MNYPKSVYHVNNLITQDNKKRYKKAIEKRNATIRKHYPSYDKMRFVEQIKARRELENNGTIDKNIVW